MEADRGPDWCPNAAMDYEVTNQIVASQQEMTVTSPTLVYRFRGQQRPPCTCDSSWAQLQNSEHWTRTLLHCAVGPPAAILAALPTASPVFPQPCLAQAPGALQGVLTAAEVNGVGTQPQGTRAGLNYSDIAAEASTAACPRDRVTMASLSLAVCNTSCPLQHQWGEQLSLLSSPQPTTQPRATEAESEWTCPICGYHQDDVAYVIPCLHQLCYGCAVWWAEKQAELCPMQAQHKNHPVLSESRWWLPWVFCPTVQSALGLWPAGWARAHCSWAQLLTRGLGSLFATISKKTQTPAAVVAKRDREDFWQWVVGHSCKTKHHSELSLYAQTQWSNLCCSRVSEATERALWGGLFSSQQPCMAQNSNSSRTTGTLMPQKGRKTVPQPASDLQPSMKGLLPGPTHQFCKPRHWEAPQHTSWGFLEP